MAQSPVDGSWAQHAVDLTQVLGELGSAVPAPRHELPVPLSATVSISRVLSAWRLAERLLGEHVEASPERTQVKAQRDDLRAAYHRLFDERNRRPEPSAEFALLHWNGLEVAALRAS